MPLNQRETGVDLHGESLAKENKREQRRQLKAAQKGLSSQLPVTDKLAYDAQVYANQSEGYSQTSNISAAAIAVALVNYGQRHDQNLGQNYDQSFDQSFDQNYYDHLNTVEDQFVADNIYPTSYGYAGPQYQSTANHVASRNQHLDGATDQLTSIIDPKMKKEERKKKKKAANHL